MRDLDLIGSRSWDRIRSRGKRLVRLLDVKESGSWEICISKEVAHETELELKGSDSWNRIGFQAKRLMRLKKSGSWQTCISTEATHEGDLGLKVSASWGRLPSQWKRLMRQTSVSMEEPHEADFRLMEAAHEAESCLKGSGSWNLDLKESGSRDRLEFIWKEIRRAGLLGTEHKAAVSIWHYHQRRREPSSSKKLVIFTILSQGSGGGWYSGNAVDVYSRGAGLKSHPW
jgi:hypothetical protein